MLGASAAIVLVLLALHLPRASDLWAALDPGFGGGFALAVICVLAAPTLVLWTAAALIGPGFQLGTHTSVDLTGAQLGAVPGLPILAALPSPGAFPGWVIVLNLIPLAAGMLAGWRVDTGEREDILIKVGLGAAAGAVAGFLLGVLVARVRWRDRSRTDGRRRTADPDPVAGGRSRHGAGRRARRCARPLSWDPCQAPLGHQLDWSSSSLEAAPISKH